MLLVHDCQAASKISNLGWHCLQHDAASLSGGPRFYRPASARRMQGRQPLGTMNGNYPALAPPTYGTDSCSAFPDGVDAANGSTAASSLFDSTSQYAGDASGRFGAGAYAAAPAAPAAATPASAPPSQRRTTSSAHSGGSAPGAPRHAGPASDLRVTIADPQVFQESGPVGMPGAASRLRCEAPTHNHTLHLRAFARSAACFVYAHIACQARTPCACSTAWQVHRVRGHDAHNKLRKPIT
jgi:hypothetical protein